MGPAPIHRGNIIEYANDAFRELVGVDVPAAVTSRSLGQFVANSGWGRLVERFEALLGGERPAWGLGSELEVDDGTRAGVIAVTSPVEAEGEAVSNGAKTPLQHAKSTVGWLVYWSVTTSGDAIELAAAEPWSSVFTLSVPASARPDSEESSSGLRE